MSVAIEQPVKPSVADSQARKERIAAVLQSYGAAVALVILLIVGSFAFPTFLSFGNFSNILTQSSFPLIVAIGMTFVILTGGIDLSVGSVFALGGVLAAEGSRFGVVGAFVLPLVVCGVIGLLQGLLVAYAKMASFIVTLAGLLAVRGLVLAITSGGATTPLIKNVTFTAVGQNGLCGVHWTVVIALVGVMLGTVALTRTRAGQSIFAVGGSESASTFMGLPVARVKLGVYIVSGLCAGLAGALNAGYSSSGVPTVGVGLELSAISAVVIGGTLLVGGRGSLAGTLAGVLLLSVIQNMINQVGSLNSSVQAVVSGVFLAIVVIIQTVLSRSQRL